MPLETLLSLVPLITVVGGAVYYHSRIASRMDKVEVEFKGISERLERLETSLSQDLRDLSAKLDRFVYNLASKKSDEY